MAYQVRNLLKSNMASSAVLNKYLDYRWQEITPSLNPFTAHNEKNLMLKCSGCGTVLNKLKEKNQNSHLTCDTCGSNEFQIYSLVVENKLHSQHINTRATPTKYVTSDSQILLPWYLTGKGLWKIWGYTSLAIVIVISACASTFYHRERCYEDPFIHAFSIFFSIYIPYFITCFCLSCHLAHNAKIPVYKSVGSILKRSLIPGGVIILLVKLTNVCPFLDNSPAASLLIAGFMALYIYFTMKILNKKEKWINKDYALLCVSSVYLLFWVILSLNILWINL